MFDSELKFITGPQEPIPGTNDKKPSLSDLLRITNDVLDRLLKMKDRSSCPLCDQSIDKDEIRKLIPLFTYHIEELRKQIVQEELFLKPSMDAARAKKEEGFQKFKKDVEVFLENNKHTLNFAIKVEKKGGVPKLPGIKDENEKRLWNAAMRLVFNNRSDDILDYEHILYEVK